MSVRSVGEEFAVRGTVRKKSYDLDSEMIETVRRLLNAETDTEAIHKALRKVMEDREIEDRLDILLKEGRFRTIYR